MQRIRTAIAVMASGAMLAIAPAHAQPTPPTWSGTVNGVTYNFAVTSGSYGDLSNTLQQQAWWGHADTIADFASVVGTSLGMPNDNGSYAPVFAYGEAPNGNPVIAYWATRGPYWSGVTTLSKSAEVFYAVATPTSISAPEVDGAKLPVAALMIGTLMIWMKARRRHARPCSLMS